MFTLGNTNEIKSQTLVQFFGGGNNGNWGVRIRTKNGTEHFLGQGAGYSIGQASLCAGKNRDLTADYEPLREGVKAKA